MAAHSIVWSASTNEGNRYGKLNQDCTLAVHLLPESYIFGVFDGHGELGEAAADTAAHSIATFFGPIRHAKKKEEKKSQSSRISVSEFDYVIESDPKILSRLVADPHGVFSEAFRKAHRDVLALRSPAKLPRQYTLPLPSPITFDLTTFGSTYAYVNKKKKNDIRMISFGTTAAVALIHESFLYTASVGDSSIFLSTEGNQLVFLFRIL